MSEISKDRLWELDHWLICGRGMAEHDSEYNRSCANELRSILTDYAALQAKYLTATDNLKAREAEVCDLKAEVGATLALLQNATKEREQLRERAEKAEADLEAARPLLDAAVTADVYIHETTGEVTFYTGDGIEAIEKAALAYREGRKP